MYKFSNKQAIILSFLFMLCQRAFASEAIFNPLFEEGKKNVDKLHNYAEGEKLLEMAMQNSEHLKPDSQEMLGLYTELGQAYACTGKVDKAETLLKKCMEIREKSKKKDDMLLFQTVMQLGTVYRRQDKFAESEQLYKRGMTMFEGKGPIKSLLQALVMYALGTLYLDMEKNSEAEVLLKQALVLRKESFLKGSFPESNVFESLGRALYQQGKLDEAEAKFKEAIDLLKKKEGSERDLAFIEGNLAAVYVDQNKTGKARELLKDSLKKLEKSDGPESSNVATVYSRLSELAIAEDRYEEADGYVRKALSIHEKLSGPNHTSVAYDLAKLIDIYRNQGKYAEADAQALRCTQIFIKALGPESEAAAESMMKHAWVDCDQGQFDQAEKLSKEAIRIFIKKDGPTSHNLPAAYRQLALIELGLKNNKESERLLLEAIDILSKDKAPNPIILGYVYTELANLYRAQGDLSRTEEYSKNALAMQEKSYGPEHPRLLGELKQLAALYQQENRKTEADAMNTRIAGIYAKHPELKKVLEAQTKSMPIQTTSTVETRPVREKWALVVGISNFADPSINLKYAAKDAIDFSNYLLKDANFAADHVKVLTDKDAGRDNIVKQLGDAWLGRRAAPDDLVVIYFSSHGSVSKNEAGGVNFLVAYDTKPDALLSTGIPMQWLSQMIKEQVHSNRVVLLMDVCHSGSSTGEKGLVRDNNFNVAQIPIGEGQAIVCSSAPEQVSWESKNYANSVFTHRLIEGLKQNNSQADLNQAFTYLRDQVEAEVLRDRGSLQTPILFSKSWKGEAPVLSVKTTK
ncbi:MAG: tetratricopeptide repeat protein [Candidatus Obscuribacterales bacterium]|nr:tetratricopeptide repeat protein [Candidatus Obscuribacterales bacterium]